MTTSTPPAWKWRDECEVPVTTDPGHYPAEVSEMCRNYTEAELSIYSRKLPDSDALRERNGSGTEPEMSSFTTRKLESDPTGEDVWPLERDLTAQLTDAQIDAVETHTVEKCPVCLHEMENDEGILCDHCGEPTGPGSFAVVNGPGGVFVYHRHCYDWVYWGEDYQDTGQIPERETAAVEETPDVPFQTQSWLFESLCEVEIEKLHDLIDDHHDLIIEMARDRFELGFCEHGSTMYSWSPKRRGDETLQEIADAVVYLTSGSVE